MSVEGRTPEISKAPRIAFADYMGYVMRYSFFSTSSLHLTPPHPASSMASPPAGHVLRESNITLDHVLRENNAIRKSKIVCTLGPACWSVEGLGKLIDAGTSPIRREPRSREWG